MTEAEWRSSPSRMVARMESSVSVLMMTSMSASGRPVLSRQLRTMHLWFSSRLGLEIKGLLKPGTWNTFNRFVVVSVAFVVVIFSITSGLGFV